MRIQNATVERKLSDSGNFSAAFDSPSTLITRTNRSGRRKAVRTSFIKGRLPPSHYIAARFSELEPGE